MEACSTFINGSSLDRLETASTYQGNDSCLNFDQFVKDRADNPFDGTVEQKWLFYQLLSFHLKEDHSRGIIRPLPVMLGDGQSLDLYKLFSSVNKRGGCASVSKKGLWGFVARELGLNLEVLASVKLIYDKYLNEFEGWISKNCGGKNLRNGNHGCNWGFKFSPLEPEKEFRRLCPNLKWKDDGLVVLDSNKISKYIDVVYRNSETNLPDVKNQDTTCEDVHIIYGDNEEKFSSDVDNDLATVDIEVARKDFNSRKRKREELSGMLNWMRHVAKNPLDSSIEPIPEPPKWKVYQGKDFWVQILRAREALLLRQCVEPNSGTSSWQKQKMHPAMYEDHVTPRHQSMAKLRCSERLPTSVKSCLCSCCNSCSATGNKATSPVTTKPENGPLEQTTAAVDLLTAEVMARASPSRDDALRKNVCVGRQFQAEVPKWTGVVSASDSKWLGTQVWPLNDSEPKPAKETDIIGRGREEKCSCQFPGSVECVRFHIAEKRIKLKLELGFVFYHWGFHFMGEEVSLQWTTEEEKKLRNMMRSNLSSQNRCFWENPFKYFFKKTRRNLVSYYFNVFIIQLRSYQNRVTPRSIDSDDGETEFGSISNGFGMEAFKDPGVIFQECSQNKQCIDLE